MAGCRRDSFPFQNKKMTNGFACSNYLYELVALYLLMCFTLAQLFLLLDTQIAPSLTSGSRFKLSLVSPLKISLLSSMRCIGLPLYISCPRTGVNPSPRRPDS